MRCAEFDTPVHIAGEMAPWAHSLSMPMYRATLTWTGFTGSPGYTNLHFLDPDPISQAGLDETALRLHNFFDALEPFLPGSVRINLPTVLEEIDSATGELVTDHPFEPGTVITGTGLTNFSAASGLCINWNTVGIINGRRIRGRTFIVPLASGAYQSDGTIVDATRTTVQTAANVYADAGPGLGIDGAIWHRPTTPGGTDGAAAGITSASVGDRVAVLKSRRD